MNRLELRMTSICTRPASSSSLLQSCTLLFKMHRMPYKRKLKYNTWRGKGGPNIDPQILWSFLEGALICGYLQVRMVLV